MSNDGMSFEGEKVLFGLFFAICLTLGLDLVGDLREGVEGWHLAAEGLGVVLALAGMVELFRRWRRMQGELGELARTLGRVRREAADREEHLQTALESARSDFERWREESRSMMTALSSAIDDQFGRWDLTPAEREVGLLLLKGLSFKEIAGVRNTSERTVRQQAQILYRKAGLMGRAELAAFFLEDLLLPQK